MPVLTSPRAGPSGRSGRRVPAHVTAVLPLSHVAASTLTGAEEIPSGKQSVIIIYE